MTIERQELIPEVAAIILDAEMENYADPYLKDTRFSPVSDGSFSLGGTFADELYQLDVQRSVVEDNLLVGMHRYGGDFYYENLTFDYYDGSIEIKGAAAGWEPHHLLLHFLFKFCGFHCLYVCYADGTPDRYWSAP